MARPPPLRGPAPGAPGPALLLLLLLLEAQGTSASSRASRPCADDDWLFDFTECMLGADGRFSRGLIAYALPDVCDVQHSDSRPLPPPQTGLPCHVPCEAGTYLKVEPVVVAQDAPAELRVVCRPCDVGHFSMGGGLLVDGASSDWAAPWPVNLQSFCYYRGDDFQWHLGTEVQRECVLHMGSLVAETRAGTWNEQLRDQRLELPLKLLDAEELACNRLNLTLTGAAVLVKRGNCTFQLKTENIAAAGGAAVVVYNNEEHAGYFYPAPSDGAHLPQVPIFMITLEDGELWRAESHNLDQPNVTILSTRCAVSSWEAMQVEDHSNETNFTEQELSSESFYSTQRRGCKPWRADASGRFVHSGENKHSHWIYSILQFAAYFVRDGHIRFRYAVDSEEFDHFQFLADDVVVVPPTSHQEAYAYVQHSVTRGPHIFSWLYQKDYSATMGEDKATVQLVEVSGLSFADPSCRRCQGASAVVMEGRCARCGRYQHLDEETSQCQDCQEGYWAPLGAVRCIERPPCTEWHIDVTYTAFQDVGDKREEFSGQHCRQGQTLVRRRWRQPEICNPALQSPPDLLPASGVEIVQDCPGCLPRFGRKDGGDCTVPATLQCPSGQQAIHVLVIDQWHFFHSAFSAEVRTGEASGGWSDATSTAAGRFRDELGMGWHLQPTGGSVAVGTYFGGIKVEGHTEPALLHFDVELEREGQLEFLFRVYPSTAWGLAAGILLDGASLDALDLEPGVGAEFRRGRAAVPSGKHRLTWSWYYDNDLEQTDGGVSAGSGFQLVNVSITNAVGAGAAFCSPCPAGYEADATGRQCAQCPAGRSAKAGQSCSQCPAGRAALAGSAACYACGSGLVSEPGAAACSAAAMQSQRGRSWNTSMLESAWLLANGNRGGLHPLRVEDRHFYLGLFTAGREPGAPDTSESAELAYWWEWLPGGEELEDAAAAAAGQCAGGAGAGEFVGVAALLEGVEAVSNGAAMGLKIRFKGKCEGATRKAEIFFKCDPSGLATRGTIDAAAAAIAGNVAAAAGGPHFVFSEGMRPQSPMSCEGIGIEWLTAAACPLCRASDYVALAAHDCTPGQGRKMTYTTSVPCAGGEPMPESFYEPCSAITPKAIAIVVAPVLLIVCGLWGYVLMLRRRYAKYMVLLEDQPPSSTQPTSIGAHSTWA